MHEELRCFVVQQMTYNGEQELIARKQFISLRGASIILQSICRGKLACKHFKGMIRDAASIKVQKNICRYQDRKTFNKLRVAVLVLQTGLCTMDARKRFRCKKQTKAATVIQARWRCHKASSHYKKLKIGSIITQCRWRGIIAKRERYGSLKWVQSLECFKCLEQLAARDTGALKEAKYKLEKQLEELTWRLQLEKRLRTDLEEAKMQEISKLQSSVENLQKKVDETNALLIKEKEAARKAIEEAPPVIKETQVIVEDTKRIESLTAEVDKLKGRGFDVQILYVEELVLDCLQAAVSIVMSIHNHVCQ